MSCEADDNFNEPAPPVQNNPPTTPVIPNPTDPVLVSEAERLSEALPARMIETNLAITTIDESGEFLSNVDLAILGRSYRT